MNVLAYGYWVYPCRNCNHLLNNGKQSSDLIEPVPQLNGIMAKPL